MRDPWGLNERAFALWYPVVVGWSENAGQRETRAQLLAQAAGVTLEVGAGSGYNLPHYPATVTELVVTEPSSHMLIHLRQALETEPPRVGSWQLLRTGAESLPFDDDSFDTVVATFVHCTIPNPLAAMNEIARVLRPAGRYLFLEHVRSPDSRTRALFQDLIEVPHRYIAAGCHPNRRTEELLRTSDLTIQRLEHGRMPRSLPSVRPTIIGTARPRARVS
jgi:ubiquinone/menaquinone biosynthesis C-methylase UbiE